MRKLLAEFKAFALRGNVIDLAVAVVIGAAFTKIINSIVNDLIMPLLGLLRPGNFSDIFVVLRPGTTPAPYPSLVAATEAGALTLNFGTFLDAVITFILVALVLFFIIKAINASRKPETAAVVTKACPFCRTDIPLDATRCPHCTSELGPGPAVAA
jgi:large conductance mechanosensitive channel